MLFDYTNISIDSINKDCSESLNLCRKIVEEIKNLDSDKEKLSKMNTLENILYNLNGRTAFLSQVHPEEKIRKECSKVEATIQNYFLQLWL